MEARLTALEAATKALSRRDRSAADLAAYLERKGTDPDEARAAVDRLRDAGYVNDERYAAARAEGLAGRGYGDEAVRFELEREGLAADQIAAALLALPPERERATAFLLKARTPLAGLRRLAAKGFSADALEAAVVAARVDLGA
ncbi:MAG TPA: RecX family transcriptional regulator [Gaiellaceae bacterium]